MYTQFANPPLQWDGSAPVEFLESHRSSPTVPEDVDDAAGYDLFSPDRTMVTEPLTYTPYMASSLYGESSAAVDFLEPQSYTRTPTRMPTTTEPTSSKSRITNVNVQSDTTRNHPLYHNVSTHADGFYHCPWEGQAGCQHKPEKLKCNY